ncbi:AraC-type DNA-binding protein [Lutibacter agarilyticus]|uniref:AraC-type DNA-binding protein n=1 Tax=Lutibacter agarilyticus TaxID=1109740 RepID=A0A238X698_9FLAO|nr:AraC family transcriptional regulator [Lutibacter agarilyticus]SNR54556.1 AraC-type DNA-binding protein [Lutibacter agarilyticus]
MVESNNKIHISFQEGYAENYISGIQEGFGGELYDNTFIVDKGPVKLKMSFYSIEGVEFNFSEIAATKPIVFTRFPDENPELLHLNIMKEGNFSHKYNKENTQMEAGLLGGVFLYNGMFPIEAEFPPNTTVKWLSFKFNLTKMGAIYDDLPALFSQLFEGNNAIAFRSNLSRENEKLVADLFAFQDLPNGKIALISSRALEIFANAALHFKKEVDADKTYGLHESDFKLLMAVKNKIINNIQAAFTIDELSKEFGVSSTKLKNDFKQLFGASIYKFYNQARMDEAYRRLKTGKFSVSEVGYDLGYSNLSKFSTMFKKIKGLLPTEVVQTK